MIFFSQHSSRYYQCLLGLAVLMCITVSVDAAEHAFTINVDEWARPRSGERIIEFQALQNLSSVWSQTTSGSIIEIYYPGGDEGMLIAKELNNWLVALGIASSHIRLRSGSSRVDQIELIIVEPGN